MDVKELFRPVGKGSFAIGVNGMAGLVYELTDLLNQQAQRYEELLGLSQEKRDVIIANDVETLQKITHLENMIISQNLKLEKKRLAVIKDMALVLNQKEDDLTLDVLIELMQGQDEQKTLIEIRDKIRGTLTELSDVNAHNGSLIANALDYIDYSLNVMRSSMSKTPNYYMGQNDQMLDSPGLIDAKN